MTVWGTANTGTLPTRVPKTTLGEMLGATAEQAVEDMPIVASQRTLELQTAAGERFDLGAGIERVQAGEDPADVLYGPQPEIPGIAIDAARARVKEAGLERFLTLPSDRPTMKVPELDIMIGRAEARKKRADIIERGPSGFVPSALSVGTSFLIQAVDPINVASAFIPVVGEARYARALAAAGEGVLARAAARAPLGAIEGAVGAAVVEPLIMRARWREGADYTMGDFLTSLAFGAGLGAGLHTGVGAIGDAYRGRQGTIPESAPDLAREGGVQPPAGRPPSADSAPSARATAEIWPEVADGVDLARQRVPESLPESAPEPAGRPTPIAAALEDLPGQVKQDLLKGAIAAVTRGEPVRAGEMVQVAAGRDPRIAESLSLADGVTGFSTAKGSRYELHADGTTTRNKAARTDPGHEGDFGMKPRTEKTYFLTVDNARALAPTEGRWLIVDHGDGTLSLATQNADGGWGIAPSARNIPFTTKPEKGLIPLEVWNAKRFGDADAFNKAHFGNEIIELARGDTRVVNEAQAWYSLAGSRNPFEEPEILASSQRADAVPEPKSLSDNERVAAAERAAAEAEELYKANEPYLPEDLKAKVDADVHALEREAADRAEVLQRGAACLAAAG